MSDTAPKHGISHALAAMLEDSQRRRMVTPFAAIGLLAIVVGGLVAAAVAHAPGESMVWMVAYLVLIAGVAQIIFGAGQAALAPEVPGRWRVGGEFVLFNLGHVGVICGTLAGRFVVVAAGTVLVWLALALFAHAVHRVPRVRLRRGYDVLLGIVALGALAGLALSGLGMTV